MLRAFKTTTKKHKTTACSENKTTVSENLDKKKPAKAEALAGFRNRRPLIPLLYFCKYRESFWHSENRFYLIAQRLVRRKRLLIFSGNHDTAQ